MVHMHDIPEELLVKIFILQPLKSLLRLRSVCKLWYKVISSDFFVKSHLAHQKTSSLNPSKYLRIRDRASYFTTLVDSESYNNILEFHQSDICGNYLNDCLESYGICDGLLCLSHAKHELDNSHSPIYIWNPILRKVKKLPRMIKKSNVLDFKQNYSYLCFGHDGDDYKVISVSPLPTAYDVHVYSLKQNSWNLFEFKKKSGDPNKFDIWPYVKARFVKGAAYFVRRSKTLRKSEVVCFDLSCKVIRRINLPCDNFSLDNFFMEERQDSIALVQNNGNHVVMWGLRVSDNSSYLWNKMFTIKLETTAPMGSAVGAMGFVNKDRVVFWMTTSGSSGYKYFLYNLENKSAQPFTTPGRYLQQVDELSIDYVRLYYLTESLVLLAKTTTF